MHYSRRAFECSLACFFLLLMLVLIYGVDTCVLLDCIPDVVATGAVESDGGNVVLKGGAVGFREVCEGLVVAMATVVGGNVVAMATLVDGGVVTMATVDVG